MWIHLWAIMLKCCAYTSHVKGNEIKIIFSTSFENNLFVLINSQAMFCNILSQGVIKTSSGILNINRMYNILYCYQYSYSSSSPLISILVWPHFDVIMLAPTQNLGHIHSVHNYGTWKKKLFCLQTVCKIYQNQYNSHEDIRYMFTHERVMK